MYLPGAKGPLFHVSPLDRVKVPCVVDVTKVNCVGESVGQVALTTDMEPVCGGAC